MITPKHGAKWASQRFRSMYCRHYQTNVIPGEGARGYWPRHYKAIASLVKVLGSHEEVVNLFTWWFELGVEQFRMVVTDPAGMMWVVQHYQRWHEVYGGLVQQRGVEGAIQYLKAVSSVEEERET